MTFLRKPHIRKGACGWEAVITEPFKDYVASHVARASEFCRYRNGYFSRAFCDNERWY